MAEYTVGPVRGPVLGRVPRVQRCLAAFLPVIESSSWRVSWACLLTSLRAQSGERRLARISYSVPIAYGTFAYHMGKKASEQASHQWIVYVRSPFGTDLSHVIKRVRCLQPATDTRESTGTRHGRMCAGLVHAAPQL